MTYLACANKIHCFTKHFVFKMHVTKAKSLESSDSDCQPNNKRAVSFNLIF